MLAFNPNPVVCHFVYHIITSKI